MMGLTQIPIGQFIPGHSFIHRLDPRSKLLFVVFYAILVFWAKEVITFSILIGLLLLSIFISRISFKYLIKSLRPILWIILFTVIIHLWVTKGGEVVWSWSWIVIYEEGLRQAVTISIRLILLILMASLLTLTTSPIDLTDGLESLFQPFVRFGLPAHEMAMMISVALRFIPTLMDEADKIMKAQLSRGADFESGNIVKRMKNLFPLLIPLFISAFRRAEDLALAMESRGYRGAEGRTKLRELSWTRRDFSLLLIAVFLIIGFLVSKE